MGITSAFAAEYGQWLSALSSVNENPLYYAMENGRRRRWRFRHWSRRLLPVIIGASAAAGYGAIAVYDANTNAYLDLRITLIVVVLVFLVLSWLIWAAAGLGEAILDMLSALGTPRRQSFRLQLDDLASITALSDFEIATGVLRLTLPGLYLRIAAGSALMALGFVLGQSDMLQQFSNETSLVIAAAPLAIINWTVAGCLGVTILMLYFLTMGISRWSFTGTIAVTSTLLSQGIWLMVSVALIMVRIEGDAFWGSTYESSFFLLATLVSPLAFAWLVYISLEACRRTPGLRLIYGSIGPLTNPLLVAIGAVLLFSIDGYGYTSDLYASLTFGAIWHFGNMLPLNPAVIVMPALLIGELNRIGSGSLLLYLPPLCVLLTQLVLLLICARYARIAIGDRRRSMG